MNKDTARHFALLEDIVDIARWLHSDDPRLHVEARKLMQEITNGRHGQYYGVWPQAWDAIEDLRKPYTELATTDTPRVTYNDEYHHIRNTWKPKPDIDPMVCLGRPIRTRTTISVERWFVRLLARKRTSEDTRYIANAMLTHMAGIALDETSLTNFIRTIQGLEDHTLATLPDVVHFQQNVNDFPIVNTSDVHSI